MGGFAGDGGPALEAQLNTPGGLAFYASDSTLFFADTFNDRIRYVDSAGNIQTLIGGMRGYDNGRSLNMPTDIELVGDTLYVADSGNGLLLAFNNVDRTGNSIAASLELAKALPNMTQAKRKEHVSSDGDVAFYNVKGLEGFNIAIDRLQSIGDSTPRPLSIVTYDSQGAQISSFGIGPSLYLSDPLNFSYFSLSGRDIDYSLTFQHPPSGAFLPF